jgi:hypothetical protein
MPAKNLRTIKGPTINTKIINIFDQLSASEALKTADHHDGMGFSGLPI